MSVRCITPECSFGPEIEPSSADKGVRFCSVTGQTIFLLEMGDGPSPLPGEVVALRSLEGPRELFSRPHNKCNRDITPTERNLLNSSSVRAYGNTVKLHVAGQRACESS